MNTSSLDLKQTAMLGALIGDAMGVPHEFKRDHAINSYYIDNPSEIPTEYKTYGVPLGVYSDDFSQMLCVNANFSEHPTDPKFFYEDMLDWERGKYWVSGFKFDEGMQTASQLRHYAKKRDIKLHQEEMSGNGGLMRVLPIAFMANDIDALNVMAFQCTAITHNSSECVKSAQFYCLLARMIADQPTKIAPGMFGVVWDLVAELQKWTPDRTANDFGSGYVIDSLNIVRDCIENSTSFAGAIKRAIQYGGDTDTNASIVGGIAALVFGLDDLPKAWMDFIAPSLQNRHVQELFHLVAEPH